MQRCWSSFAKSSEGLNQFVIRWWTENSPLLCFEKCIWSIRKWYQLWVIRTCLNPRKERSWRAELKFRLMLILAGAMTWECYLWSLLCIHDQMGGLLGKPVYTITLNFLSWARTAGKMILTTNVITPVHSRPQSTLYTWTYWMAREGRIIQSPSLNSLMQRF